LRKTKAACYIEATECNQAANDKGERIMNIVIIGSGFGGLSAAIRLQAQEPQVTIVEKRDKPGGRAYVYMQEGR
jgi:monoamine oxidase